MYMLLFLILLHNNNDDNFLVLLQTLPIQKKLSLLFIIIMPIQKNNSCRMGGPEKGQWVAIILIRASTGVCEHHNHLPSEFLPRSHLQTLGKALFLSSSPDFKKKNINLLG